MRRGLQQHLSRIINGSLGLLCVVWAGVAIREYATESALGSLAKRALVGETLGAGPISEFTLRTGASSKLPNATILTDIAIIRLRIFDAQAVSTGSSGPNLDELDLAITAALAASPTN